MSDTDGKSQIISKWRTDPSDINRGQVPDDLKDCVEAAAQSCPTNIIHVEPA